MKKKLSFLVENWWFCKKNWKKILIGWVTDSEIPDFIDFDKNFPALPARSSNLSNFNQIYYVISSVLYLDSKIKLKSGQRTFLILSLKRE
jgi:hypothetical protein